MTKEAFIEELRKGLSGLPAEEIEDSAAFYREMILDRMDAGLSEEEAVAELGSVSEAVSQIIADMPLKKIVKERVKRKRRLTAFEIVLLIVGSPLWLALLIVLAALILVLYAVIWAVAVVLWTLDISLAVGGLGGVAAGVVCFAWGQVPNGLFLLGAGLITAGLSVLLFFGCIGTTKGLARLTGRIAVGVKKLFIRKENEK